MLQNPLLKLGTTAESQHRVPLDFDQLYGKAFKITDNSGDPNKEGFSIVTPVNDVWNEWNERPEFKDIVRQRLNDPDFLADYKYNQIVDSAKRLFTSSLKPKKALDAMLETLDQEKHPDSGFTTQNGKMMAKGTEVEQGALNDGIPGSLLASNFNSIPSSSDVRGLLADDEWEDYKALLKKPSLSYKEDRRLRKYRREIHRFEMSFGWHRDDSGLPTQSTTPYRIPNKRVNRFINSSVKTAANYPPDYRINPANPGTGYKWVWSKQTGTLLFNYNSKGLSCVHAAMCAVNGLDYDETEKGFIVLEDGVLHVRWVGGLPEGRDESIDDTIDEFFRIFSIRDEVKRVDITANSYNGLYKERPNEGTALNPVSAAKKKTAAKSTAAKCASCECGDCLVHPGSINSLTDAVVQPEAPIESVIDDATFFKESENTPAKVANHAYDISNFSKREQQEYRKLETLVKEKGYNRLSYRDQMRWDGYRVDARRGDYVNHRYDDPQRPIVDSDFDDPDSEYPISDANVRRLINPSEAEQLSALEEIPQYGRKNNKKRHKEKEAGFEVFRTASGRVIVADLAQDEADQNEQEELTHEEITRFKQAETKSYGVGTPLGGTPTAPKATEANPAPSTPMPNPAPPVQSQNKTPQQLHDEAQGAPTEAGNLTQQQLQQVLQALKTSSEVEKFEVAKFAEQIRKAAWIPLDGGFPKEAAIELHKTPTSLPPRDDMRRHIDETAQAEAKGVKPPPPSAVAPALAPQPQSSPQQPQPQTPVAPTAQQELLRQTLSSDKKAYVDEDEGNDDDDYDKGGYGAEGGYGTLYGAPLEGSIQERLEYLRGQLQDECISQEELMELSDLSDHIEPGDVVIQVNEEAHPLYKRRGADLLIEKEISLLEALTGVDFVLTHLDDRKIRIKNKAGEVIKPDDIKTVEGHGMPYHK